MNFTLDFFRQIFILCMNIQIFYSLSKIKNSMKILDFWRKISNKLILKEKVFEFSRQKCTINNANYGQKLTSKYGGAISVILCAKIQIFKK